MSYVRRAVALAVAGAAALAAGVGWIYPPAGVIAAGIQAIVGAYLVAYFGSRRRGETARRPAA